jgi:flavin reductase (DIM6/NTAB) family NADH-FMN oxidoreductase RutF
MAVRFLSESEINSSTPTSDLPNLARTVTAPMPQVLLVVRDPELVGDEGICVRTVTMGPMSWGPYTKSISIPQADQKIARCMSINAQCVLALPTRTLLRQISICTQRFPRGVSEAAVARFAMCESKQVQVPSIGDCPVNLECVIDHVEDYQAHRVAFVRVVGASIDPAYTHWDRAGIIQLYPTNFADEVVDQEHGWRMRVSLLKDIHNCPTFPVGEKVGWGSSFDRWIKDLADEKYLSADEHEQVAGWSRQWKQVFQDVHSDARRELRTRLQQLCHLMAGEQWAQVHTLLAATRPPAA